MSSPIKSWKAIPQSTYKRARWKNGLGHTDEIAIFPESADLRRGDFLFRLSSAEIAQNSPFSIFPNHDRALVILKGEGIRLRHRFEEDSEPEITELPAFQVYDFPGDIQSECELLDGPVRDFSLFFRKGELEAVVEAIEIGEEGFEWQPSGRWNFILAATGQLSCVWSDDRAQLHAGDSLSIELKRGLEEQERIRIKTDRNVQAVLVSLYES